jgi:ATP:corrinoid adenosyltransferase
MKRSPGITRNHATGKTYISHNHICNAPAAVQAALHHRLAVTERDGCQVVALDEVFALLEAALLEVEGVK